MLPRSAAFQQRQIALGQALADRAGHLGHAGEHDAVPVGQGDGGPGGQRLAGEIVLQPAQIEQRGDEAGQDTRPVAVGQREGQGRSMGVPADDEFADREAAGFLGATDMETIADGQPRADRHRRAPDDAGLIGRGDPQIGGIALAEPLGHLLAARHVALAQGGGLGPGAEKLAETLDQPGVLVVKHRGEPFRLVMDRGHAFVAQGDLVGDLDREDGNDGQEDEHVRLTW